MCSKAFEPHLLLTQAVLIPPPIGTQLLHKDVYVCLWSGKPPRSP